VSLVIDLLPRVTLTPTAGVRWENYPLSDGMVQQAGLRYDHSWNAGAELSYVMTPDTTLMVAYMREDFKKWLIQQSGTAATGQQFTDIRDYVDTVMFAVNYAAIPNKLDFTFRMTNSWSRDAYTTPVVLGGFPDVTTMYQRFDAVAKYKVDPETVHMLGWKGDVTAKLRYAWERNSVGDWQNDVMGVYMFSKDPTTINTILLAYNNPNYNVHLLAASLAWKW
jgi:hypothetical protein